MRYRRKGGGVVEFGQGPWEMLLSFRQLDRRSTEAGGILLGRIIRDSSGDVVIDLVTEPGPYDRRGRTSFRRSRRTAQPLVVAAWNESSGTRVYLGDWHSHPEDYPMPSCVDERDWKRALGKASFEQSFLLFVIVGREEIRVWEGNKKTRETEPLRAL